MKKSIVLAIIALIVVIGGSVLFYNSFNEGYYAPDLKSAQFLGLPDARQSGDSERSGVTEESGDSRQAEPALQGEPALQAEPVGQAESEPNAESSRRIESAQKSDSMQSFAQSSDQPSDQSSAQPSDQSFAQSSDQPSDQPSDQSTAQSSAQTSDQSSAQQSDQASNRSPSRSSDDVFEDTDSPSAEEQDDDDSRIKLPDFTVKDAYENDVRLSGMLGKPVIINFWASWCPPCQSEMPDFDKVYQEVGGDVQFMMIDAVDGVRETKEKGVEFIKERGFTFPVYFDINQEVVMLYGIRAFPTTLFVDREGYVVGGVEGAINEETLRKGIDLIRSED